MGQVIPFPGQRRNQQSAVAPGQPAKSREQPNRSTPKDEKERQRQLRVEANRIATELGNAHRFLFALNHVPNDNALFLEVMARVQSALTELSHKFGRASLYNLGGVLVRFNNSGPSAWVSLPREGDSLHLNNNFNVHELKVLISPRLKPETDYRHEWFDVSHKNHH